MSEAGKSHVMPTYNRAKLDFVRGKGAWLFTADDTAYLDFACGIAVNALGHSHPALVAALKAQADKLWHVSNIYTIGGQEKLAEQLCALSFADKVFFCNSGAEAVEGAIKTARKYHAAKGAGERVDIIGFDGAFHGRTLATLAAAGNAAFLEGCGPLMQGFVHIDGFDLDKTKAAIGAQTAAIIIEPVQGDGGIMPVPVDFLRGLRELCDAHGVLLIFDEVQCGMGRSGKLWAHEYAALAPDIMAIAKGFGGGFPTGAFLASEKAAAGMGVGTHGSTYGGNPLACAVASKVLDIVATPDFLQQVTQSAKMLRDRLCDVQSQFPTLIEEVRGLGLLLGLKISAESGTSMDMVTALRAEKLLTAPAKDNVVRLMPPLNIGEKEIETAIGALAAGCARLQKKQGAKHE